MIDEIDFKSLDKGLEKGKEYKEKINNNELEELKELADKIEELNDTADDSTPVDLSSINSKIADTKDELKEEERKLNMIQSKEKAENRIDELQEEEQTLVNNYETLEKELYDIEKYIKTEIEMLEDDVNGLFELTHFKLFKTQVNGAITETCEAMKAGVPYSELNTGSKYQVGMDIIRTFSNHYGILAPVFIDNRERIAKLPEIDSQTIQLVMTPDRDSLETINTADEEEMATFIKDEAGIKRETLF
jgi:DNA repair exonuclease SbcCD ATPase subunit